MSARGHGLGLTTGLIFTMISHSASAEAPATELLDRLAIHATNFEKLKTRATCTFEARVERLSSDGDVDSVREMTGQLKGGAAGPRVDVSTYIEDGEDKTADARRRAKDYDGKKKRRAFHMPFLPNEQPAYTFDRVETDLRDPSLVRIAFVPKTETDDSLEGSAWVDTRTGAVLSAGFKMVKTSAFVDYVHVTVEFGAPTPLGPAVSKIHVTGRGGFLFFRKRFSADVSLKDYKLSS